MLRISFSYFADKNDRLILHIRIFLILSLSRVSTLKGSG